MALRLEFSRVRQAPFAMALTASLVMLAHGCGGTKECTTDADCDSSQVCSFATSGCATKGTCASWDNVCEAAPAQACGCDGMEYGIACGYPGAPKPTKALGACPVPSGNACATNDDCDVHALCAFPVKDGCNAKGTCVVPIDACTDPVVPACGCNGETVGINCAWGAGNAPAPVASMGACQSGDAGADASNAADSAAADAATDAAPE